MKKERIYYVLAGIALLIGIIIAVTGNTTNTNTESDTTQSDMVYSTTVIQVGDEKQTYEQTLESPTTALGALQALEDDGTVTIETTDYDFGTIVDSIDGTGQDTTDNKYWIYYVNGSVSDVGASSYILQNNDEILWNYEAAQ